MTFENSLRTGLKAFLLGTMAVATAANAQSNEQQALDLLKGMSDYIGSLSSIETTVDTSLEVVTAEMEKLAFTSTSILKMTRPNMVRLERSGGYSNVEFIFDGTTFTIRGRSDNVYAQVPVSGTTDDLVRATHDQLGLAVPAADLLLRDSYSVLVADVMEAKYIGEGVVGGQTCDHVAFRNLDTDWQLWIRQGAEKAPCKMIITSKTVGMAPQYVTHVRSWNGKAKFPSGTFAFRPTPDERRLDVSQLTGIDEVPPAHSGKDPK